MPPLSQRPAKKAPSSTRASAKAPQGPVTRTVSAGWQGPLPPPSLLADFDRVIPNGAERIMRLAEEEQSHRHAMDNLVVSTDAEIIVRGHWFGLTVAMGAIAASVISAIVGAHWSVSIALVGVPLASVAKEFLKRH